MRPCAPRGHLQRWRTGRSPSVLLVPRGSNGSSRCAHSAFDGHRARLRRNIAGTGLSGALTPQAREIFGDQPRKVELYEAEQAVNDDISIALLDDIVDGRLKLTDILTDTFLRELHQKLYGDLWTWAGRYRTRDLNIGVDRARIAVELRGSLGNIRYRWEHTEDWAPRELGIAVHAETVRIHGFVDGNGRSTRLLADLVFLAAQDAEAIAETYDWRIDEKEYIALLREYDLTRDPKPLAEFVPVRRLDDAKT